MITPVATITSNMKAKSPCSPIHWPRHFVPDHSLAFLHLMAIRSMKSDWHPVTAASLSVAVPTKTAAISTIAV